MKVLNAKANNGPPYRDIDGMGHPLHRAPDTRRLSRAAVCFSLLIGANGAVCAPVPDRTIGLALVSWTVGGFQSKDGKKECPDGFDPSNQDNFKAQFPTPESRDKVAGQTVHLGRAATDGGPARPEQYYQNRGPDGVTVVFSPTVVEDPLPLRTFKGKVAFGLDLDGDSHHGPTCKHEEFVSPEGKPGVDNQLWRVMGCNVAWREGGFNDAFSQPLFVSDRLNRVLIQITEVDDSVNDDHVVVNVYKGVDPIQMDTTGKPIPWRVNRIDVRFPRYMSSTTGRIVNGVLETEPMDARFSSMVTAVATERFIRGMRLRLVLDETSARGLLAGYENLEDFYLLYAKSYGMASNAQSPWSPPSTYAALYQNADGFPDSKGSCTAISAAYEVKAVRTFIVRPKADDPLAIDAPLRSAENTLSR